MHPDLERVARLAELDAELDRVVAELKEVRGRLARAEAAERDVARERDAAQAALDEARRDERAIQRKLEEYRGQMRAATRMLETGAGNADAAERQLAQCRAIIDATETEYLELMEKLDGLVAALDGVERRVAQAGTTRADAERDAPPAADVLAAREADLRRRREALFAELPADMRGRYTDLREGKRKTAVSAVEDGTCKACRMTIAAQLLADLRRGLIHPCRGCGRWLVV